MPSPRKRVLAPARKPQRTTLFVRHRHTFTTGTDVHGPFCYVAFSGRRFEVVCFRRNDGAEVWRYPLKNQGHLFAATDDVVLMHVAQDLTVLSAATGSELWRRASRINDWKIWRDCIVFAANPLQVLDPATGRQLDAIDLPCAPQSVSMSGHRCVGYTAYADGLYYAVDLEAKRALWERELRSTMDALAPAVPGGDNVGLATGPGETFLLSYRHHVFAFSVTAGELLWHREVGMTRPPRVTEEAIYLWCEKWSTPVQWMRLDPRSGETVFCHNLSRYGEYFAGPHLDTSRPLVYRDHVIVTSQQMVLVFSASTGDLVWHHRQGQALSEPVVIDDRLFVVTTGGELFSYSLEPD